MPTPTSASRIGVFGHQSAAPAELADTFGGKFLEAATPGLDLAIFAVNPNSGIDAGSIEIWAALDEWQIPRLVVVTGLNEGDGDFDDAVLVGRRVFDLLVTPFLVLHDDAGLPCALISLDTQKVIDYSTLPATISDSEDEHKTLISEFVDEYKEEVLAAGEGAFEAGLLFPAIPVWLERGIGVDIVKIYIEKIEKNLVN